MPQVCESDDDCRVDGVDIRPGGCEMHAVFAPATAADCVVMATRSTEIVAGSKTSFELRISDAKRPAVCIDGSEDVTAFLSGLGSGTVYGCFQLNNCPPPATACSIQMQPRQPETRAFC